MLEADAGSTSMGRTAVDNETVRTIFVVRPDKRIGLYLTYPMATGRNFHEILRALKISWKFLPVAIGYVR